MSNSVGVVPKSLIVFGICIPIALLVGYLLATPGDYLSFGGLGLVLGALCIPLLLRWHHPALIFFWNANVTLFLLPGQPSLWIPMTGASLGLACLACLLNKETRFQNIRSITWPVLFLTFVVLVTAKATGGIGLHSIGSEVYGGRKFFTILAAVAGYFAISSQRIPVQKAGTYCGLFFLSGLTGAMSNLIYLAGPSFYFLYLFFPTDNALAQAMEDFALMTGGTRLGRLPGVTAAAMAALYYVLSRYGIRGVMDLRRPLRLILLLGCLGLSMLGGFRSAVIIFSLLFAAQFCLEGLLRTRLLLVVVLGLALGGAFLAAFATKLPLAVQRSLSVLPIEIDMGARLDAQASLDWRLDMWKLLRAQVGEYFWLGKGYALNPTDLYLTEESVRRGLARDYESSLVAGDYHSGPFSVMIPFGIFGLAGLVWLLVASIRVLYRNYRLGDPALQRINTFLLSFFLARAIFYFIGFGALHADLPLFLGILGFSVALNGDKLTERTVRARAAEPVKEIGLGAGRRLAPA